jgi:hypothetical protein
MIPPTTMIGCSWGSRAVRYNPHPLHIRGRRIGILGDRSRDVGSPFATVTDYFWREETPWLVLQLPDGRRTAAPAAWTDLPAETFPLIQDRPLLLADALPAMARLYQRLRAARSPRRRPPK